MTARRCGPTEDVLLSTWYYRTGSYATSFIDCRAIGVNLMTIAPTCWTAQNVSAIVVVIFYLADVKKWTQDIIDPRGESVVP